MVLPLTWVKVSNDGIKVSHLLVSQSSTEEFNTSFYEVSNPQTLRKFMFKKFGKKLDKSGQYCIVPEGFFIEIIDNKVTVIEPLEGVMVLGHA